MLAILIIIAIVGGIAFFLVFTQGLFSSVIMCVLILVSALIAFNYYELLGAKLNNIGLAPYGGKAISLMVLFIICLLVMRLVADRLIKGNMKFPLIVDRVASGFFGLLAGMMIAGIVAIGFQMLPTPAKIIGFDRLPKAATRNLEERNNLFPNVDGFVSAVVGQASKYGFAGSEKYSHYHPDLLEELYLQRLTLDPYSRQSAATDSIKVEKAWMMENSLFDCRLNEPLAPEAGEVLIAVRLSIQAGSGKKDNPGASDGDGKIRFTLGNVRLLGFNENDKYSKGLSRYPLGILKPGFQVVDGMGYDRGRELETSREVDLLFSWPENYKKLKPFFIELKGSARATMPSVSKLENQEAPDIQQWFDASKIAAQADLEAPAETKVTYVCQSLSIWSPTDIQGKKDFKLPLISIEEKIRENQKYTEIESTSFQDGKYVRAHYYIRPIRQAVLSGRTYELYVPKGYDLLCLRISGNQSQVARSFILPALLDTQQNEILPVGIKADVRIQNQSWTELAYSVNAAGAKTFDQAYPNYKDIWIAQKKATLDTLLVFYLIPNQTPPVGIVGCRTRTTLADPGQIWNFTANVDTILVPTPAEK